MFQCNIRDGVYLALLEERHAAAIFTVVNRDRALLRKWLPWVDLTRATADTLKFIGLIKPEVTASEVLDLTIATA